MPTIGVALAIPEPWASQLQDYRSSIGDATATKIPTHITLIPPTELLESELDEVEKDVRPEEVMEEIERHSRESVAASDHHAARG